MTVKVMILEVVLGNEALWALFTLERLLVLRVQEREI